MILKKSCSGIDVPDRFQSARKQHAGQQLATPLGQLDCVPHLLDVFMVDNEVPVYSKTGGGSEFSLSNLGQTILEEES